MWWLRASLFQNNKFPSRIHTFINTFFPYLLAFLATLFLLKIAVNFLTVRCHPNLGLMRI